MPSQPRCPCGNYQCKGRGLYSRPGGSWSRHEDLYEGSQCGRIFWAAKWKTSGWRPKWVTQTLLDPTQVPIDVLDTIMAQIDERDLDEIPEPIVTAITDRFDVDESELAFQVSGTDQEDTQDA